MKAWVQGAVAGGLASAVISCVIVGVADGEPGWIAAAAACAGAGAAWTAAINGSRTLAQARSDSRARTRPMVSAELRSVPYTDASQALVIKNHGPTIARNVMVTFDPKPGDDEMFEGQRTMTPFLTARYSRPIPSLVPGVELDNLWYVGVQRGAGLVNVEPTPDQVTVRLDYEGPDGAKHHDEFFLDVDVIRKRTYTVSSLDPSQQAKEAIKVLKEMAATLKRSGQGG